MARAVRVFTVAIVADTVGAAQDNQRQGPGAEKGRQEFPGGRAFGQAGVRIAMGFQS